jgi:hypothetical protein
MAQPRKDERSKSAVVGRIPGCYPALKTDRITLEASLESWDSSTSLLQVGLARHEQLHAGLVGRRIIGSLSGTEV